MVFKCKVFSLPMTQSNSLILRGISHFLNNKQVHLTNPTILLSFQQNWLFYSNQNNQNSSLSIQKVFSGKSRTQYTEV